jgi:hypothetical protein
MFSFSVVNSFHPNFLLRVSTSAVLIPLEMCVVNQSSGTTPGSLLPAAPAFPRPNFHHFAFFLASAASFSASASSEVGIAFGSRYVVMYFCSAEYSFMSV